MQYLNQPFPPSIRALQLHNHPRRSTHASCSCHPPRSSNHAQQTHSGIFHIQTPRRWCRLHTPNEHTSYLKTQRILVLHRVASCRRLSLPGTISLAQQTSRKPRDPAPAAAGSSAADTVREMWSPRGVLFVGGEWGEGGPEKENRGVGIRHLDGGEGMGGRLRALESSMGQIVRDAWAAESGEEELVCATCPARLRWIALKCASLLVSQNLGVEQLC